MKLRTSVCFILAALIALTACSTTQPKTSSPLAPAAPPPQANPENNSFFMTVPFDPADNRYLEIRPVETALISIASVNADLPLQSWTKLGWVIGCTLGESDTVPEDCALHFRIGIARQVYAACAGPATVAVPDGGGDFVYIVFTDTHNRIARVVQTGSKYNPDTTGLIP
jgi:hypothetical protein